MTTKNVLMTTILSIFVLTFGFLMTTSTVFAEEISEYKMADDVSATVTFTFRGGVETHEFPVFKTTSDFVSNVGTTFNVQGVVGEAPYLHKALDEAFKYRLMYSTGASSFEYDYRFFDVDVELTKNDESIKVINYYNCEIQNYKVETLNDDYESYGFYDNVGFVIVDDIEFRCGGVSSNDHNTSKPRYATNEVYTEYTQTPFAFAEDARTIVTFTFDEGIEKIEFPIFELEGGFGENNDAGPSFHVEGIVANHPLLDNAINQARKTNGLATSYNTDFEALVEFTNNGKTVRSLQFNDCRASSFFIDTYQDKEEGYTGKRGFAVIETIDFTCAGLSPQNPTYNEIKSDAPIWSSSKMSNTYMTNTYNMGTGPHAIVTFTYNDGQETIDFPIFEQGNQLKKANPTVELVGVPGSYPLLYKNVDFTRKLGQKTTGTNSLSNLFDMDVNLMYGEKSVRQFHYSDCRSVDYVVKTQHDKEESFFKGFALTNEFHLECKGYQPSSPLYNAMFDVYEKAKTTSTNDLRKTNQWGPGFYVE